MKKFYIIGTLVALALIVFGVAGYAYAQSNDDENPNAGNGTGCGIFCANGRQGNLGHGMMGYRGFNQGNSPMFGGNWNGSGEYGPLHDYMISEFAQALEMTPEELGTRHQAGDTLWEIAQEQGLTTDQFLEMMTTARTNAVNQAVVEGVITQEQADFMLSRMQRRFENGVGPGFGTGNGSCPHGRSGMWNNQP